VARVPASEPVRRVGRPRVDPTARDGEPREEILDAAAKLFSTVGYARTTTRAVAAASGLRQPSLFHYFPTKEDLLAELLDRTVSPALAFLHWLLEQPARPEVQLYALAWRDTDNLCAGPHNLGALQLLPEARAERFSPFWTKRTKLQRGYRTLVRDCGAVDAELTTELVFGLVESVIVWYRRGGRHGRAAVAHGVARGALRLTTGRSGEFPRQRAAAVALLGSAPGPAVC
jgi:AcrR family transcriptional regulator